MKSSAIVCAIAALSLGLGSVSAFAQGSGIDQSRIGGNELHRDNVTNANGSNQRGHVDNRNQNQRNYDQRNYDQRNQRNYDHRDNDRRAGNGQRYYYNARSPEFHRGGYIPYEYRNRQYYVSDWRGHHLYAPPRGYQWVQVGGDYVLIAIATGIIASLILNQ